MEVSTKTPPLEAVIVRQITRAIQAADSRAYVLKVHGGSMQRRGVPDLLVCREGRFFALEVKRPDGYGTPVSRSQEVEMALIQRAGGVAVVVRSVSEAMKAVGL